MKSRVSIFLMIFLLPFIVNSQILRPGRVIERKVVKKINEKVDKAAEKMVDSLFDAEEPNKTQTNDKNKKNPSAKQSSDSQNNADEESQGSTKTLQVNSKYDFVAGEKIIFFDDFGSENVGDFPVLWNTTGSGEIVTNSAAEGKWFMLANGRGITTLMDPLPLPENYTIEFDVIPQEDEKNGNSTDFSFYILSTSKPKDLNYGLARPGDAAVKVSFEYSNYFNTYFRDETVGISTIEEEPKLKSGIKYRISIWVQKERFRLYVNETKLFDVPKAMSKNYKYNMIRFDAGTPLLTNIRIATGLPDMRSKLITEGKLVSYGIYFDVNKDIVKPESAGTLKMISTVLKENPGVRIKIVGHTDSDGNDKDNLDLSKRRSEAVKKALVDVYGIEASILETDGKGESEPINPNDSAVNKAKNRRVEFIKL